MRSASDPERTLAVSAQCVERDGLVFLAAAGLPAGTRRFSQSGTERTEKGVLDHPSGTKTFIVNYRTNTGRERRLTLGRYGVLTPDQARKEAVAVLGLAAKGSDPAFNRRRDRKSQTVNELMDRYLSEHVDKNNAKTTAESAHIIVNRNIRPRLGNLKIDGVTRQDVAKLHRAMAHTPRQANLAHRPLRQS